MKNQQIPLLTCRECNRDLACNIPSVSLHPKCLLYCHTRAGPAACLHNGNKLLKTAVELSESSQDMWFCGMQYSTGLHVPNKNIIFSIRSSASDPFLYTVCSSTVFIKSVSCSGALIGALPICRDWVLEKLLIANKTYLTQTLGLSFLNSSHVFRGFHLIIYF